MNKYEGRLQAEAEARKDIAQRLHQGLIQSLATIAMRAGLSRKMAQKNPEKAIEEISSLENLARDATKEARYLLFVLDPALLESQGLLATIKEWLRQYQELFDIAVMFDNKLPPAVNISPPQSQLLFSILVQLLDHFAGNKNPGGIHLALGQDNPKEVHVTLTYTGRELTELVRNRVEAYTGRLESMPGPQGTRRLKIWLPLEFREN